MNPIIFNALAILFGLSGSLCSGQLKLATALEFSSIGFPIRLGATHRYSHAALASCNTRRYSL